MRSLYLEGIRSMMTHPDKYKVLVLSGLINDYIESLNILNKFNEWYELKDVDSLISYLPKLNKVRDFVIRYLTAYLYYKNKEEKYIKNISYAVNYYLAHVISELQSAIEFFILKSKGERAQALAIHRILLYIGELLEFYKIILLRPPEEAINYVSVSENYIDLIVAKSKSLSKKVKEAIESVEIPFEELLEESEEEKLGEKSEIVMSAELADKAMKNYINTVAKREEIRASSSKLTLFNRQELNLLHTLIVNKAFCPEVITIDRVSEALSVSTNMAVKIAKQINAKCKDRLGSIILLINEDRGVICLHKSAFDNIAERLAQYHPDLVALYRDMSKQR